MKKIFLIFALVLGAALSTEAQKLVKFYQPLGTNLEIDTVTNTGTAYVTTKVLEPTSQEITSTTIQVVVTKISGIVGGTISLLGSIDGTNFKALVTEETQTALATITATDGSSTYHWRLKGSPFTYYRVSWTGTGTMAASFSAKLIRNR